MAQADEELYPLAVVLSDKKDKATFTLSKTDSQKAMELKGHKLKDHEVKRTYNSQTKTISIRVTIPKGGGNLYGKDIIIPSDGNIDADKTLKTDMDIGKDSIKFTVFKLNQFDMNRAVM